MKRLSWSKSNYTHVLVSKHSLTCIRKSTLIFFTLTEILSKVVLHVQMLKKRKVISSLNKRLTENVLNWSSFCLVTAAVLPDVFSTSKSVQIPSNLGLVHCFAWTQSHQTWTVEKAIRQKWDEIDDQETNSIEGYMWNRRLAELTKQDGDQFSTASIKLVLILLLID